MTQTPEPHIADLAVGPARKPIWQRVSLVWLVPFVALAVSLFVAWQNYASRGTLIEISFENAAGIVANETVIKYRDVTVGRIEKVTFADGLSDVLVYARVDNTVAEYLDDDAQFWVVRPNVSVRGISGLDTVLSGVYIEGTWDGEADVAQLAFVGVEDAPISRSGQRGSEIRLRARDGSALAEGAPILHKGIDVGFLEKPELSFTGNEVIVTGFIREPYDKRITSNTRFWDTSGFSINLGAGGVSLDVNSLASLIEGGIAFDTVVSGGRPLRDGQLFDMFPDESSARSSLFADPNQELLNIDVLFDGSVNGLTVGSEVQFQSVRIGEVSALSAFVEQNGTDQSVRLRASLAIEPSRLGLGERASTDMALTFLEDQVAKGLRARMITGNILSGSLKVEFLMVENLPEARVKFDDDNYPLIPSTVSEITDVAATAEGVLNRINRLPVEELMTATIDTLGSIERLANDDNLRQAPLSLAALLDEAREVLKDEDLRAIPKDLRATVAGAQTLIDGDIAGVATDLRAVVAGLDGIIGDASEAELIEKLGATLETAQTAVTNIEVATRDLPKITKQIEALTAKANELELQALVDQATGLLDSADKLISSDATANLPASLSASLDEMRLVLAEIREGGAIENVNAALASANQAARAIETSVAGLPALSTRASRLVTKTEEVIAAYGDRSRFSQDMTTTLRDIQAAADAVTSLARTIQRNPSSLLTGR